MVKYCSLPCFKLHKEATNAIKCEKPTQTKEIEVKPSKEAIAENAKSKKDKSALLLNTAKWAAALTWCKKHGITFRVLTEKDIYITKGKQLKKKKKFNFDFCIYSV